MPTSVLSGQDGLAAIGRRLREVRTQSNTSQIAAADRIGVSHRAYHSYEKGERGIPIEALILFGQLFDVDPAWLLLGTSVVRLSHDFEALRSISVWADEQINALSSPIPSVQRGKLVYLLYKRHLEHRDVTPDVVQDMLSLLSE